jgi:hypothetical protein
MAVKKYVAVRLGVIYDSPGDPECLGRGLWWRELKEGNKPPCQPKYTKKAQRKSGFPHFFGIKITKNAVFRSKVLNEIYSQDVF